MRNLNFIVQAKGGVFKSSLMYYFAIKYYNNHNVIFIDADSSTHTSMRQLKFLDKERLEELNLLNDKDMLVRDNLVSYLEYLAEKQESDFEAFFDFGSPESEMIPGFLNHDLPFKEFLEEISFTVVWHVVIGAGGAYSASVNYLKKIIAATKGEFRIIVWSTVSTFSKYPELAEELKRNCKQLKIENRDFADIDSASNLGSQVLDGMRKGFGLDDYSIGAKIKIKNELKKYFSDED